MYENWKKKTRREVSLPGTGDDVDDRPRPNFKYDFIFFLFFFLLLLICLDF
jgi:hypothetical protein